MYDDLSEDEKDEWDALEWNEEGEVPDAVSAAEVNKFLFNTDTVDKVLETLMRDGLKVAGGDRLGKTIIFAKNHQHAVFIEERFNNAYPHYAGHFARTIDFKTEYAQSLIEDFYKGTSAPYIAISVDMLDTGIDVPEVLNLVFFKVVRSRTKFWQMLGRGTRLCPDIFGPGDDKTCFAVFDFCQNLEFFAADPPAINSKPADSLSRKLFRLRLDLIGAIDGRVRAGDEAGVEDEKGDFEGQTPQTEPQLRDELKQHLHNEVEGMNLDNFIVRAARLEVEKYKRAEVWSGLKAEEREELAEHVAGLPVEGADEPEEAKRFDHLILSLQLALLKSNAKAFESLRRKLIAIVEALEAQSTIPMIHERLDLIQEIQTDTYWQNVTAVMLETVRRCLRGLVHLIESGRRKIVYTDFEDELGESREIELPGTTAGLDFERFRRKARSFLKDHLDHVAIQKLRRNLPLTETDLSELERILASAGSEATAFLPQVHKEGLTAFIRVLVGLDQEAAKQAFGRFLSGENWSGDQIEFVNLIIDHLTEAGALPASRLYESPFTDHHSLGVAGMFPEAEVVDLIAILQSFEAPVREAL